MSEVQLPVEMNKDIKIWIDGEVFAREDAKISVFDSLVQGGDGVWEGLRVYNGRIFQLEEHLDRMMDSAKVMFFYPPQQVCDVSSTYYEYCCEDIDISLNSLTRFFQVKLAIVWSKYWSALWNMPG